MARMHMTVVLDRAGAEKAEEFVADGRDIRAYEAEFEESFLYGTTYTQLSKIAFCALRRLGRFKGGWEQFDEACLEVEEAEPDEGELDPATPTRTDLGDGS